MPYTVKKVASIANISVRTLHHYDAIGLLKPESVSESGYRLYSDKDLERLQQILFYRELGFDLKEIKRIMNSPLYDRKTALEEHRLMLTAQRKRIDTLIASVDKTLDAVKKGKKMTAEEMFEGLDKAQVDEWTKEAYEKYDKALVDESVRRTSKYTKEDWVRIMAEGKKNHDDIAALMDKGPADPEVQRLIGEWHAMICKYYYECTMEIFRGLGELYVNDPRFKANYEQIKPGMAQFMHDAIMIYATRAE